MPEDITGEPIEEAKVGARNSLADQTRLQAAHDALVEAGALCGEAPKSHRKAITDAPNLRGNMEQACANCAFYKAMPGQETMMGDAVYQGVCQKHEFMSQPNMVCDDWKAWEPEGEKSIKTGDMLVSFGGEVKALGDGCVGGYLVRFSTPSDPDLELDFFKAETYFGEHAETPIFYHHGMDSTIGKRVLGSGKLTKDDVGVWVEAQLEMRDDYEKMIYELASTGKLGWSSGVPGHLVEREQVGKAYWIKMWLLGNDASLTPTPAEPRNSAIPLKSLYEPEAEASESPVKADGSPSVTELTANIYQDETVSAGEPLPAKEIKMAENEEGKVVTPAPEFDYDKLAEAVAKRLDPVGAAKSAPAVIKAENLGDPDPYRAFAKWAKGGSVKGIGALGGKFLNENQIYFDDTKAALQEASGEGAELVPDDFYPQIVAKRDQMAIARRAGARVLQTSRDIVNIPVENASMGDFAITAEEGTYDENEPTFATVAVTVYKLTKRVLISEELLEDDATNLDAFLMDGIARAWALTENKYTLVGTGTGQPQGVFVGGSVGYTFADTNAIAAAEIPALYWTLGDPYHDGASWTMRGATAGHLQGLTGNNFQLVPTPYSPNQMVGDFPFPLWNKPVFLSDSAVAIATGAKTVMFGNWNYYGLVERRGLTISRNPYLYQATGQVGIFCSVRFGGAVLQSEAFKWGIQA